MNIYVHILFPILIYLGMSFWFVYFAKSGHNGPPIPMGIRVLSSVAFVQVILFFLNIVFKIPFSFTIKILTALGFLGLLGYIYVAVKQRIVIDKIKGLGHIVITFPLLFVISNGDIIPAFVKRRWDEFTHWSVSNFIVLFTDNLWKSSHIASGLLNPAFFFYPPGGALQICFFHMLSGEYIEGLAIWGLAFYYFAFLGVLYDVIKITLDKRDLRFLKPWLAVIAALSFTLLFAYKFPILKFLELLMNKHQALAFSSFFLVYIYIIMQKESITLSSAVLLGGILSWVGIQRPYAIEEILCMLIGTVSVLLLYNMIRKRKLVSTYLIWHLQICFLPLITFLLWRYYVTNSGGWFLTSSISSGGQIGVFTSLASKSPGQLFDVLKTIIAAMRNSYHSYRFPYKATAVVLFLLTSFILAVSAAAKGKGKAWFKYKVWLKPYLPVLIFAGIHFALAYLFLAVVAISDPSSLIRCLYAAPFVLLSFSYVFLIDMFFALCEKWKIIVAKYKYRTLLFSILMVSFFIWGLSENVSYFKNDFRGLYVKDLNHCWYAIFGHTDMDYVRLLKNRDIIEREFPITRRFSEVGGKHIGFVVNNKTKRRLIMHTLRLLFGRNKITIIEDADFPLQSPFMEGLDVIYVFDDLTCQIDIAGCKDIKRDTIAIKKQNNEWKCIDGYTKRSTAYTKETMEELRNIYINKAIK